MSLQIYGPGCYNTCNKETGKCDACGDGYCCSQEETGCPKTVDSVLAATKADETKKDYCVTLTNIPSGYYEEFTVYLNKVEYNNNNSLFQKHVITEI